MKNYKRIKLDCPIDWLEEDLNLYLNSHGFMIDNSSPNYLVVNPGTDRFLGEDYFSDYPTLVHVGTPSTGKNHVDTDLLAKKRVKFSSLLDNRDELTKITASSEFTWLHIMSAYRMFLAALAGTASWRETANESKLRSRQLSGATIGIIGFGRIGQNIARYALAFGMRVKFYDPHIYRQRHNATKEYSIADLATCDIISINCSLNESSTNLISRGTFENFKDGLVIVNTSRGEVIDEDYICDLVEAKKIIYSCDVVRNEQNAALLGKTRIFKLANDPSMELHITPHVAGATVDSQKIALEGILSLM